MGDTPNPVRPEPVEGRPTISAEECPSTSSGRTEERYRAAASATLAIKKLPPFIALYHRESGVTHLLVEPAPEILTALTDEPLSLDELRARLATRFEVADGEALSARLQELVAAGLVAAA